MTARRFDPIDLAEWFHADRKRKLWPFLLVTLFMPSCEINYMHIYSENAIEWYFIREMADDTFLLTVIPAEESIFWCPGAILEEKDDALLVGLVRCYMKVECPVDVAATLHPARGFVYNIALPSTDKPIKLNYPSGAVQIWPRGTKERDFSRSSFYQEDEIHGHFIGKTTYGVLLLEVVPIREASFWCPGAVLEEKEDAILVGLVRCRIDSECPVDVASTLHSTYPMQPSHPLETAFLDSFYEKIPFKTEG